MNDFIRQPDPWSALRRHTSARIALGRAGGSLPTGEVLSFTAAHAAARDAVHSALDESALAGDLAGVGLSIVNVASAAHDRATYLQRPDLGRRLDDSVRESIASTTPWDVALIIADGLSAPAVQRHAAPLVKLLVPMLQTAGLTIGPLVIVRHGRVAIEDEIGQRLRAACAVILIGERPGLGSPDSLGAYLTFNPKPGNTDADRNCVSNIRPQGLPLPVAAETLRHLIVESLRLKISGVQLKDERTPLLTSDAKPQNASLPDRIAE